MILDEHKRHQIIASMLHANAFINISDQIGPPFWEKEVKMKGNQFVKAAEQKYKVLATALFDIEGGDYYLRAMDDAEDLIEEVSTLPWFCYYDIVQLIKKYKDEKTLEEREKIQKRIDSETTTEGWYLYCTCRINYYIYLHTTVMKDHHKFLALIVGVLTIFFSIHLLSVKKTNGKSSADAILRNQIEEQQKVIDEKQVEITQLQRTLIGLKGDVVVIDNKSKETKTKYKDEKRYIDLATPSQQSNLLSANLTEFKDLDKKGYFDLPEGRWD